MADIKSMDLNAAKAYLDSLKKSKSAEDFNRSKEVGKVRNYIKTLDPNAEERYGKKDLGRAYEQLSRGVTEVGGWTEKNAENIFNYTGKYPDLKYPTDSKELPSFLDGFQDNLFNLKGSPETREGGGAIADFKAQLSGGAEAPDPLNRVEQFEK